jgi:hypothetical protein
MQKTLRSGGIEHRVFHFDCTRPGYSTQVTQFTLRCFFCLHVDRAGKLGELFVGGFFLV